MTIEKNKTFNYKMRSFRKPIVYRTNIDNFKTTKKLELKNEIIPAYSFAQISNLLNIKRMTLLSYLRIYDLEDHFVKTDFTFHQISLLCFTKYRILYDLMPLLNFDTPRIINEKKSLFWKRVKVEWDNL